MKKKLSVDAWMLRIVMSLQTSFVCYYLEQNAL
jgi:hypothetical protein